MTRIIMVGCNGHMGQVISQLVEADEQACIVAGVDISEGKNNYPVYANIREVKEEADAIIDFSSVKLLDAILEFSVERQIPAVLCTTGYSVEQVAQIEEASKKVGILRSANMSLGINTMVKVMETVTKTLAEAGFDVEIVEKHHNQKLDAPSGTALALADAINGEMDNAYDYCYDRSAVRQKRPKKEIGISAVRGGTIVGEHEIIFAGTDEVLEFKHTAYSKAIFGKGAISAAKYMGGKPSGLYNMKDVIG